MLSSPSSFLSSVPPLSNLNQSTSPSHLSPTSPNTVRFQRATHVAASCNVATEAVPSSFYDVLGIPVGASNEDIKVAYRRLARSCHPDVNVRREDESASDEFMRVHAAYSTLSDPHKRADYDQKLFVRSSVNMRGFAGISASPSSSYYSYPRRNWESDQCW